MNKEACEKVYGKFINEDENFYYFEGKILFGVTISKHAYFDIQPERTNPEDVENDTKDYEDLKKILQDNPLTIQSICDVPNTEYKQNP